jgi:hypothetical protein
MAGCAGRDKSTLYLCLTIWETRPEMPVFEYRKCPLDVKPPVIYMVYNMQ